MIFMIWLRSDRRCFETEQGLPNLVLQLRRAACLFNYHIRQRQHIGGNRDADLFRCLQIDRQLELYRLLDGHVGGVGALKNTIYVISGAIEGWCRSGPSAHEAALLDKISQVKNARQPVVRRKLHDFRPAAARERVRE